MTELEHAFPRGMSLPLLPLRDSFRIHRNRDPVLSAGCLLALVLCAVPDAAAAQTLTGHVGETGSGAAVPDAELVLLDTAGRGAQRVFSDSAGGFTLEAPNSGEYTLRVRVLGYMTFLSQPLLLHDDETVHVRIRLGRSAIPIEPLVVTGRRRARDARLAGFERRRLDPAFAGGHFLTQEDIERRPTATATDLVVVVPGVRVQRLIVPGRLFGPERGLIRFPGRGTTGCAAQVYVDGVLFRQTVEHSVDDVLDASMIGGIEVYARAETAPLEFVRNSNCGVVLYWTRAPEPGTYTTWRKIAAGIAGFLLIAVLAGS